MARNPTWRCVVAGALRREDGRWLMHRRPAHKQHGGLWEFPGGKVEPSETPVSALIRELGEELGIGVDAAFLKPLAFAQDAANTEGITTVILLYTLDAWRGDPRALEDGAAIGWFTAGEIHALERPPLDVALCAQMFIPPGEAGYTG